MLSKRHPIGVMIYASAEVMGYPWETIIKMYRKSIKEKSFPTLHDQVEHFLEHLRASDLFGEQTEKIYIETAFESVASDVLREVERFPKSNSKELIATYFDQVLSEIKLDYEYDLIDNSLSNISENELVAKYKGFADKLILDCFAKYEITEKIHSDIYSIMKSTVFRNPNRYMGSSGLVFSGFGDSEVFPTTESFVVASVLKSQIMMSPRKNYSTDAVNSIATILPFAQSDVIDSFVYGIDPSLNYKIREQVAGVLNSIPDVVSDLSQEKDISQKTFLSEILSKMSQSFLDSMKDYINNRYMFPMLQGVSNLSPNELASMAETLVNLTSFKKKISADQRETVGGPTDVAVITKGDGFIWINRKHYFSSDKNHHFFTNYYNEEKAHG
jgi:hypothetical protein